jgi:hypothetical protein
LINSEALGEYPTAENLLNAATKHWLELRAPEVEKAFVKVAIDLKEILVLDGICARRFKREPLLPEWNDTGIIAGIDFRPLQDLQDKIGSPQFAQRIHKQLHSDFSCAIGICLSFGFKFCFWHLS